VHGIQRFDPLDMISNLDPQVLCMGSGVHNDLHEVACTRITWQEPIIWGRNTFSTVFRPGDLAYNHSTIHSTAWPRELPMRPVRHMGKRSDRQISMPCPSVQVIAVDVLMILHRATEKLVESPGKYGQSRQTVVAGLHLRV
jgi:hypothetical protein